MERNRRLAIFFIFFILFTHTLPAQKICILQPHSDGIPDKEALAALMFLNNIEHFQTNLIEVENLRDLSQIQDCQLIWFHHTDTTYTKLPRKVTGILKSYVESGGKLMLTLEGFRAINDLKLETEPTETRQKKAEDNGYGRQLGLHAFRSHPVFEGLNGGAYIFKPYHDTTVRITGFFDDHTPTNGNVIAVDWDYIFVRENTKLMLEYLLGQGKILAIGGYTCMSQRNLNSQHLRMFLMNCLDYLMGREFETPSRYWSYGPQEVVRKEPLASDLIIRPSLPWPDQENLPVLGRKESLDQYWDVAGERMLVMGNENGGIDEIWAHPFMALKDYKPLLVIPDSIIHLNQMKPQIEVRPASITRIYTIGNYSLKEVIITSNKDPVAIVHYEYSGPAEAELLVKFKSNLRFMWPYSENVLKKMHYTYDPNLNAMIIGAEDGEFNCMIGANKEALMKDIGQYDDFILVGDSGVNSVPTDNFQVAGIFQFAFNKDDRVDLVIATDLQREQGCIEVYTKAISDPLTIFKKSQVSDPAKEMLTINSPDTTFNEGFAWALRATDRFFVNTPGLGSSLVAGYGTTKSGWDGGQTINGRPGYAWYFGRDGQWSGLALLDYGDFEKVKQILEMYQQYQDLNGKIYHEVSTSGIVHYDAADATPLYIILAGRYLRHSGDVDFIRQSWFNIYKALEYCFSTDTDGDHLIENTNVGHGWVEGGGLFGSHSSLYLSSCWAEALREAAYMASAIGNDYQTDQYLYEAAQVEQIINTDFWNKETQFLNQGKYKDGNWHTEPSILTTIPMYFGQIQSEKTSAMLPVFASNNYSADWGCRIVSRESKFFNPNGYHSGSVWPLFTGWAALAEYKNGRPVQGFTHIMNNLLVYQHWGLGFIEEVLNGETYKPSGVCHHQCWSETMVLQPAIEGMLGIKPDAINHLLELSPQLPPDWDSLYVQGIRMGDHTLAMKMTRHAEMVTWELKHEGPSSLQLKFNPFFEPGTIIKSLMASGEFEDVRLSPMIPAEFFIDGEVTLNYKLEGGIVMVPVIPHPEPGDISQGIKIIRDHMIEGIYYIELEGLAGTDGEILVFARDENITDVEGGKIISQNGNLYTIATTFAGETGDYINKQITVHLKEE